TYPAPILKISFNEGGEGFLLERIAFRSLTGEQASDFLACLKQQAGSSWKVSNSKRFRWDMAILVNPAEQVPPSNKAAIRGFIKAAEKLAIRAQTLSADELVDVNHFDALFIRETTAINHHTYRLACDAESKGLVVLDDPQSILRCCNKVFL